MSQLIGMDDQTVIGAYNTGFETEHRKPGTSLSDAHHGGKMAVALAAQVAVVKWLLAGHGEWVVSVPEAGEMCFCVYKTDMDILRTT